MAYLGQFAVYIRRRIYKALAACKFGFAGADVDGTCRGFYRRPDNAHRSNRKEEKKHRSEQRIFPLRHMEKDLDFLFRSAYDNRDRGNHHIDIYIIKKLSSFVKIRDDSFCFVMLVFERLQGCRDPASAVDEHLR